MLRAYLDDLRDLPLVFGEITNSALLTESPLAEFVGRSIAPFETEKGRLGRFIYIAIGILYNIFAFFLRLLLSTVFGALYVFMRLLLPQIILVAGLLLSISVVYHSLTLPIEHLGYTEQPFSHIMNTSYIAIRIALTGGLLAVVVAFTSMLLVRVWRLTHQQQSI